MVDAPSPLGDGSDDTRYAVWRTAEETALLEPKKIPPWAGNRPTRLPAVRPEPEPGLLTTIGGWFRCRGKG